VSCYCWSGTATKGCIVQPAKSVLTLARAPIGCVLPALLCGFICRHRSTGAPEQSQTTRFKTIPTPDAPHHHQERAAATHSDSGNTQQQHEDAKAAKSERVYCFNAIERASTFAAGTAADGSPAGSSLLRPRRGIEGCLSRRELVP
jgi:hypothetical protein